MASQRQNRVYTASIQQAWHAIEQTCSNLKWTTQASNPEQGTLQVKSGVAVMCPFGVLLNIKVSQMQPGMTDVAVEAKSQGQAIDYGQSGREVQRFYKALDAMVSSVDLSVAQPQSTQGPACSKCGSPLQTEAKFCRKCGEPVSAPQDCQVENKPMCSSCGRELAAGARFCTGCGQSIAHEE